MLLAVCPFLVAQQALNNDAVINLVKAGLSDDLIVSTINASAGNFDTSAAGLIALNKAGASDKVISTIVLKGLKSTSPAAASASAPGAARWRAIQTIQQQCTMPAFTSTANRLPPAPK
jgi:hypothetical protein